jgi:hypothetical protein
MLSNPNNPKSQPMVEDLQLKVENHREFNYKMLPSSFFASIISARRGGKSFMVNNLIQQFQRDRHLKFSHIFLISGTGFGFKGIPPAYKFDTLDALDYITSTQQKIVDYNRSVKDADKRIKSRILIVLDDMAFNNTLKDDRIERLALNGRHYETMDKKEGNGISVFLISQALKRISRTVRLNQDVFFVNNISSLVERNDILDESFYIDTTREGKKRGQKTFEMLSTSKDFRFIAIMMFIQNKRKLEDYIMYADAKPMRDFKFFGTAKDWKDSEDF